jgi:hypothetical protein
MQQAAFVRVPFSRLLPQQHFFVIRRALDGAGRYQLDRFLIFRDLVLAALPDDLDDSVLRRGEFHRHGAAAHA